MAFKIKVSERDLAAIKDQLDAGGAGLSAAEKEMLKALLKVAKTSPGAAFWDYDWERPKRPEK